MSRSLQKAQSRVELLRELLQKGNTNKTAGTSSSESSRNTDADSVLRLLVNTKTVATDLLGKALVDDLAVFVVLLERAAPSQDDWKKVLLVDDISGVSDAVVSLLVSHRRNTVDGLSKLSYTRSVKTWHEGLKRVCSTLAKMPAKKGESHSTETKLPRLAYSIHSALFLPLILLL
jgi:hypothetical protein